MFATALLAVSCGEVPQPEAFAVATTTALTAGAEAGTEPDEVVGNQPSATSSTIFVPQPEEGYVPEVLISTANQLLLANEDGTEPLGGPYADIGSVQAADDLLGGLVVQEEGSGEIVWYGAQGQEPQVVADEGARLLDVGYLGAPFAVVLNGASQIDGIRLIDNELTPILTLNEGEELVDLSVRAGLYAVVVENEECGDLRFYDTDGAEVQMAGPGEPECTVPRRPAYGAVALSPDASSVLYTVISYRDDSIEVATDLVARDLVSGVEIFPRRQIAADAEQITALSYDGERAVYLRQSGQPSAVEIQPIDPQAIEEPVALLGETSVNSVAFTRLAIADGA